MLRTGLLALQVSNKKLLRTGLLASLRTEHSYYERSQEARPIVRLSGSMLPGRRVASCQLLQMFDDAEYVVAMCCKAGPKGLAERKLPYNVHFLKSWANVDSIDLFGIRSEKGHPKSAPCHPRWPMMIAGR